MSTRVRLGSRRSALAMWQAHWVAHRLTETWPEYEVDIVPISTRGDEDPGSLTVHNEKGVFTSDLEAVLAKGEIDLAVHSLKDLPVASSDSLVIAAVPLRGDVRDVLVSPGGLGLTELPAGSRIGTSSPRRASLLRARRPDVDVVPIRGNVDTRVRQVEEGAYDAIVVAAAAMIRLGLESRVTEWFDPRRFPPAPGQGALAVQARRDDSELVTVVARMDDSTARLTTAAERSFLAGLGGGCSRPIGAHAWRRDDGIGLVGFLGSPDGRTLLEVVVEGDGPEAVGARAADRLLATGARELLR